MRLVMAVAMVITIATATPTAFSAPTDSSFVLSCDVMPGWAREGTSRLYEGENLYEYMDGNSEGYYLYGFVRMKGVTCAKRGEKVLIDVSEMNDEEGAYGIFCANRDARLPSETIATSGQVAPRKAIFAKGRFFAEIAAQSEGDYSALLRVTAQALATQLAGSTTLPEAVSWFIPEGLTAGPPRLVPESVLGIRALRRGYVAQYGAAKAFLVIEKDAESARQAMTKLRTRFAPLEVVVLGDEAFQAEDKYLGRLCIARQGRHLLGYANVTADGDAVSLARALLQRMPQ
jgi:hypothetical protein